MHFIQLASLDLLRESLMGSLVRGQVYHLTAPLSLSLAFLFPAWAAGELETSSVMRHRGILFFLLIH